MQVRLHFRNLQQIAIPNNILRNPKARAHGEIKLLEKSAISRWFFEKPIGHHHKVFSAYKVHQELVGVLPGLGIQLRVHHKVGRLGGDQA